MIPKSAPLIGLSLVLVASAAGDPPSQSECFVLWGGQGDWECTVAITGGWFSRVEPYMFTGDEDRISRSEKGEVACTSHPRGGAAGLHLFLGAGPDAVLRLSSNHGDQAVRIADLAGRDAKIFRPSAGKDFLVFGEGDPGVGPQGAYRRAMATAFQPPTPESPVALPADWWQSGGTVAVKLSAGSRKGLAVRRVRGEPGTFDLEIYSSAGPLGGTAEVAFAGKAVGTARLGDGLWLSLAPHVGRIAIDVACPDGTRHLTPPTTLVETRGSRIFVDGEPFLIKGTLPAYLTDADARYLKEMGFNTLRLSGRDHMAYADRHGFMALAVLQGGGLEKLSSYDEPGGAKELAADLPDYYSNEAANGRVAVDSPYTLIVQLDNERSTMGANPLDRRVSTVGADPWSEFVQGDSSEFARLNQILLGDWNLIKPMGPMLLLGYANECQGYIAPYFLDVVMHNTYLPKDRYGVPLKEFMRWEGCDHRPFVNSEYGANRYTPEAYHGAKNSPMLEALQAWGYRKTWTAFMAAGTAGGTDYRLDDLAPHGRTDQGTSNFGIMTYDHQPKLACWELWHLFRDFEVEPSAGSRASLVVGSKRDYWARECRLTLRQGANESRVDISDVPPNGSVTVPVGLEAAPFRWEIDFTSHGGLKMAATGAYPRSLEREDFLERMKKRENFGFLSKLLDAKLVTVEGRDPPDTVIEMKRADDVVPLAFQCADGTVYVTAFVRTEPGKEWYAKADIATAFSGTVEQVDESTGQPISPKASWESTGSGVIFRNVDIPAIPGPIGERSNEPLSLPVFRIAPPA